MLAVRARTQRKATRTRDPERTRARLLEAAFQEIYRSGFRSADVDAILAEAGVTKGALYYHFDSKEALGYAVVDELIRGMTRDKWVRPLQNAKNPIDALLHIIHSLSLKVEDLQHGCPLLNLSQEMAGLDEGFRRRTVRVFRDWHDAIAIALREGQKRRVVRRDISADETATFLIATYEGYVALAKASQDPQTMRFGQRLVREHLESLRPTPGRTRGAGGHSSQR